MEALFVTRPSRLWETPRFQHCRKARLRLSLAARCSPYLQKLVDFVAVVLRLWAQVVAAMTLREGEMAL